MTISCSVLLICDDDLLGHEVRKALGTTLTVTDVPATGESLTIDLNYQEMVLHGTWEMQARGARFDLAVVSLVGSTVAGMLRANPLSPDTIPAALYLVDPELPADEAWSPRKNCHDLVLYRPVEVSELRAQVIAMLRAVISGRDVADEARLLSFMRERIANRDRVVSPVSGSQRPGAGHYPEVAAWFGPGNDPEAALESLVGHGLATRRVADRMRSCPGCASTFLIFGEVCPSCASPDFQRVPVIHHFACGHSDLSLRFGQGDALTCPKCAKTLHQIGRDYERPMDCLSCQACGALSSEARIVVRCAACRRFCSPEATAEHLVHAYELTPLADEAVAAGSLSAVTLQSVLARRSGLCTKVVLLFELDRELARRRRYESPSALLMARIDGIEAIRAKGSIVYVDHLERCCAAITSHLRDLDMIAIWDADTVAMLLPETSAEGANIVACRMEAGITAMLPDHALRIHITIGITDPAFASAVAMVEACLSSTSEAEAGTEESLDPGGSLVSASDSGIPLVLVEDETQTANGQLPTSR